MIHALLKFLRGIFREFFNDFFIANHLWQGAAHDFGNSVTISLENSCMPGSHPSHKGMWKCYGTSAGQLMTVSVDARTNHSPVAVDESGNTFVQIGG